MKYIEKPYILLISGYARNGKDTFANILSSIDYPQFRQFSFAHELKKDLAPLIESKFGWDVFNLTDEQKKIVRPILIAYGCAWREINKDHWVEKVDKFIEEYPQSLGETMVITDCRFLSEYEYFVKKYGREKVVLVEVSRIGAPPPPEEELKNHPYLQENLDYRVEWNTVGQHNLDSLQKYVKEFYDKYFL